jgi:hypothetical protein
MISQGLSLVTKGYISCNTPITKGVILLCITETRLKKRRGVGVQGEEKRRKVISVFYNYDNQLYEFKQIVNENVHITMNDVNVEIIDKKPIISFKIEE